MGLSSAATPARESQEGDLARQARLADLREQYRNGTYQVDIAELSAKLVEAHIRDNFQIESCHQR